jgi:hypothetical protein
MPEAQPIDSAQTEQHLIRDSVQYLQKLTKDTYGSVKTWTPAYVQRQLDSIENFETVTKLTGSLESVSEPLITSLDSRLDGMMQNLEISNLSDLKTKTVKLTGDLANTIKTGVETRTEPLYSKARELKTDIEKKAVEWKSVRGDLTKKTIQRLENGLTTVKQITSEQSEKFLHIDLIKYASEVIDNAQSTVVPTFEGLNKQIAAGIVTVSASISSFQEMAQIKKVEIEAYRAELKLRLAKAIAASRELSQHSAEYVLTRYNQLKGLDREQIQAAYNGSIQYILESPKLFAQLTQRIEQMGSDLASIDVNTAVDSIHKLLSSLQEVVLSRKSSSEGEGKVSSSEDDVKQVDDKKEVVVAKETSEE